MGEVSPVYSQNTAFTLHYYLRICVAPITLNIQKSHPYVKSAAGNQYGGQFGNQCVINGQLRRKYLWCGIPRRIDARQLDIFYPPV